MYNRANLTEAGQGHVTTRAGFRERRQMWEIRRAQPFENLHLTVRSVLERSELVVDERELAKLIHRVTPRYMIIWLAERCGGIRWQGRDHLVGG